MGKERNEKKSGGERKKRDPSTPRPVHYLDNRLAQVLLGSLRKFDNPTAQDRQIVKNLGFILALEACRNLPFEEKEIQTPLGPCKVPVLKRKVVLAPVLRAGMYLHIGAEQLLPDAELSPIWLSRDEVTLSSTLRYGKPVTELKRAHTVIMDVMLATGGSASKAVETLKSWGADNITFAAVLTTQEGIDRLQKDHPDVRVVILHKDPILQPNGYIYPGLGDAGDRLCGTVRKPKSPKPSVETNEPKETKETKTVKPKGDRPPKTKKPVQMKKAVVVGRPAKQVATPPAEPSPVDTVEVVPGECASVSASTHPAHLPSNGVGEHVAEIPPAPPPN